MKKTALIIFLLIILAMQICHAEGSFNIRIENAEGKQGDIVEIPVKLENNSGILAMHFDLSYDQSRIQLLKATDTGLISGGVFSQNISDYPYIMLWNSASKNNFSKDGTLLVLEFKIKDTAALGEAYINLSYQQENIYDVNLNDVMINVNSGSINVIADKEKTSSENINSHRYAGQGSKNNSNSGSTKGASDTADNFNAREQNTIIFTVGECNAIVFGVKKTNDAAPVIRNDRTMLPARFVAESLGAAVIWTEEEPDKVLITKENSEIILYIGSSKAFVNGIETILDSPAFIENNRTYTPVRFIAENLGARVYWNEGESSITIIK